ncbi:MAG: hypothetical protein J0I07_41775 [Myxococcales bacterium]|nr:hypothetical protein [Myxococcales bacterium]
MKYSASRLSNSEAVALASRRSRTVGTWRLCALALVAAFYGFGAGTGCGSESSDSHATPPDGGTGGDGGGTASDGGADSSGGTDGDGRPRHAPSSLRFGRDQDPRPGFIAGTVVIGKAPDESDVNAYRLYWASDPSTTLGPAFASLPKTGSDITYELDASVPDGGAHLIALSANDEGETSPGATTPAVDNFPVFVDITVVEGGGVGRDPSAVVDDVNGKLLVAITSVPTTGRLGLVHCNLDGTNCKLRDISHPAGEYSGTTPSAVIDPASGKLLVATQKASVLDGSRLGFFSSNLDGSGARAHTVEGPRIRGPSAVLDTANGKVLVAVANRDDADRSLLYRCDIATGNCSSRDMSPDGGRVGVARYPSAVLDEVNGKVFVVMGDATNARSRVARCNLDGTNCTFQELSSFLAGGSYWDRLAPVVDAVGRKLLVVGPNLTFAGRPALVRCDLDTDAGCTLPTNISAGQPDNSGRSPSAVIDTANGKLLVVAVSPDHFSTMGLFRCNLDGTACTHTDISVGHEKISNPSAVLDKANGRLLVAASYADTRLGLFSIGLW